MTAKGSQQSHIKITITMCSDDLKNIQNSRLCMSLTFGLRFAYELQEKAYDGHEF